MDNFDLRVLGVKIIIQAIKDFNGEVRIDGVRANNNLTRTIKQEAKEFLFTPWLEYHLIAFELTSIFDEEYIREFALKNGKMMRFEFCEKRRKDDTNDLNNSNTVSI